MGMIPKYSELSALSDDELRERYDAAAKSTVVGTGFYLDELRRRAQQRQNDELLALTRQVRNFTFVVTLLTLVNVALVAVALWR
jgi:signal transduction histidine kinase